MPAGSHPPEAQSIVPSSAILLVEDNPAIAKTLSRLLRRDDHVVDTVANGQLALVQLQTRPYDLILNAWCELTSNGQTEGAFDL
jgi:DNA-binding NtrC family response regulator